MTCVYKYNIHIHSAQFLYNCNLHCICALTKRWTLVISERLTKMAENQRALNRGYALIRQMRLITSRYGNTIPGICSRSKLSGSLAWANHSTCIFSVAYFCTMVPLGAFACQRVQASPLGHWTTFYTQQCVWNLTFAIRKRTKNMASVSVRVGICAVLFSAVTNRLPPTPLWHSPYSAL